MASSPHRKTKVYIYIYIYIYAYIYIYIYIYIWPAALSYCLAGHSPRPVPRGYAEAYAVYI